MSGWFPRISPDAQHWVAGNGTLTLDGHDLGPGYGPKWQTAAVFFAAVGSDLIKFTLSTDRRTILNTEPVSSIGFTAFDVAPDGRWVLENNEPQRIVWHDGGEWLGWSSPTISNTRWAALIHNGGQLYAGTGQGQNGTLIDGPNCLEPRLCGDLLVWRKGLRIFGQYGHGGRIVELTVPGEEHFWPVPLIVNGLPYVLTNTNRGRLLLYPFPPVVADGPPPAVRGWTVARGTTDFADAVPIDERFVRVVWSVGGAEVGEVIDTWHDDGELQDVPWTAAPGTFHLSDWLATCTARYSDTYYWRKGDPVGATPFAAWMRVVDGQIGLLADTSTGERRPDGSIDKMYFAGPYLWAPLTGPSGWGASYVTDFVWDSHTDRNVPVIVGMECGFARFNGIDVRRRHIYDPRRPDPQKPARKTGYREYAYLGDDGHEEVFEEWQDNDQGVLQFHRRVQPVPRTGPEGFVSAPRPTPYPPITGDDMLKAPGVTVDHWDPVIRPGQPWKFIMHDRNNGTVITVELRNGSVYGSIKNAIDEDHSGSFRPVAVQP